MIGCRKLVCNNHRCAVLKVVDLAAVRRIVVLRPIHRLGNALLLTPLVQELEACFPDAEIEIVTTGSVAHAVFERFPGVTAVHSFPCKSYRNPVRVVGLLLKLKLRSYDLAIDPNPHSRAGRFLLGQVNARVRVGFTWGVAGRDRMLTHAVFPALAPPHCAQSPVFLLRSVIRPGKAAGEGTQHTNVQLCLRLSASEKADGASRLTAAIGSLGESRPVLGIFAHATGSKRFPVEWWVEVIAKLRARIPTLLLLEFIPADGLALLGGRIPALHTGDLRLLGATLAATSMVAIADCGVMHLADAAGARVLGLFKTTEPSRYGPGGPLSVALIASDESTDSVVARIQSAL